MQRSQLKMRKTHREGYMGKKKANKLTKRELEKYKELLLEKRQEILSDVMCMEENIFQGGGELSTMPVHMADIGTDSYEQEFSLGLMEEEKRNLIEIQQALVRIDQGIFGICEGLGIPIEKERLEAIPWTRYSLEYARRKEKGLTGGSFRRRPIDIQREEESEEDEDLESEDVNLDADSLDLEEDADLENLPDEPDESDDPDDEELD